MFLWPNKMSVFNIGYFFILQISIKSKGDIVAIVDEASVSQIMKALIVILEPIGHLV